MNTAVVVTEEQQHQRKLLKAAVETLKREYQKRGTKVSQRLRPVVPKLYTKGAAGKEELMGHARYWDREQGANDEQHDLWGWRILDALQKARARTSRCCCTATATPARRRCATARRPSLCRSRAGRHPRA